MLLKRTAVFLLLGVVAIGGALAVTSVKHTHMESSGGTYIVDLDDAGPFMHLHLHLTNDTTLVATNVEMKHVLYLMVHQHTTNSYDVIFDSGTFAFGDLGTPTNPIPTNSQNTFIFGGATNNYLHEHSRAIDVK